MPFKDKIKSMLHSHKKTASTSSSTSSTAAATSTADPNKPPNARDPGFRKSFNLGDEHAQAENTAPTVVPEESISASVDVPPPPVEHSQNLDVPGKQKMYTVDRYGEDYLAVSPRTNATVPENPSANRGLSGVVPLEGEDESGPGQISDTKTGQPIDVAAAKFDQLSSLQGNPDYGRDNYIKGEHKDAGLIEPVSTREGAVDPPKNFVPDFLPSTIQDTPTRTENTILSSSTFGQSEEREHPDFEKYTSSTLSPPKQTDETTSSIYSDDNASRPPLPQTASSIYAAPTSLPTSTEMEPIKTAEQQQYTSLLSDVITDAESPQPQTERFNGPTRYNEPHSGDFFSSVKTSFPDSARAGEISPSVLPTPGTNDWSEGLLSDINKVRINTPQAERSEHLASAGISSTALATDSNLNVNNGKLVQDTSPSTAAEPASDHEAARIDAEAAAFADLVLSQRSNSSGPDTSKSISAEQPTTSQTITNTANTASEKITYTANTASEKITSTAQYAYNAVANALPSSGIANTSNTVSNTSETQGPTVTERLADTTSLASQKVSSVAQSVYSAAANALPSTTGQTTGGPTITEKITSTVQTANQKIADAINLPDTDSLTSGSLEKPIQTTTNTIPHAEFNQATPNDAFGSSSPIISADGKPEIPKSSTEVGSIPDTGSVYDKPEVLKSSTETGSILDTGNVDGKPEITKRSTVISSVPDTGNIDTSSPRPGLQTMDSVLAVTKNIPGGFD